MQREKSKSGALAAWFTDTDLRREMEKECACPEAAAAINSGVSATTCPTEEMIHLSRPSAPGPRDQDEDHVVQFHVNPGVTVSLQVGDSVRVVKGACVCICPFSRCFQLLLLCLRVRSYLRSIRPLSHPAGAARRRAHVPPGPVGPWGTRPRFLGIFATANFMPCNVHYVSDGPVQLCSERPQETVCRKADALGLFALTQNNSFDLVRLSAHSYRIQQ